MAKPINILGGSPPTSPAAARAVSPPRLRPASVFVQTPVFAKGNMESIPSRPIKPFAELRKTLNASTSARELGTRELGVLSLANTPSLVNKPLLSTRHSERSLRPSVSQEALRPSQSQDETSTLPFPKSLNSKDDMGGKNSSAEQSSSNYDPNKAEEIVDRVIRRRSHTESDVRLEIGSTSTTTLKMVQEHLPYLLKITKAPMFFDKSKGAEELSACIAKFPEDVDLIRDALQPVSNYCKLHKSNRLEEVLILALASPKNVSFFHCYFKNDTTINHFAKKAVLELHRDYKHSEIMTLLAAFTVDDLAHSPHRNSLFRQVNISSSLCREYGSLVFRTELDHFRNAILKSFKAMGGADALTMDRTHIRKLLSDKKEFTSSTLQAQDLKIDSTISEHAKVYIPFAESTLNHLYAMKVPAEFSDLLIMRRNKLIGSLENKFNVKNALEASRGNLGELLFIRIISPEILSIFKPKIANEALMQKALVPLTKIITNGLAFEVPFDDKDKAYKEFNPLLEKFRDIHNNFVDLHSLEKK